MSPERVAVLYSRGPHFARAVAAVQRTFAETEVRALLPPSASDADRAAVPEDVPIVDMPGGALATRRFLRSQHYDGLVVLFPSPRLRLLAAMSKARQRWVCGPDGRVLPLDETAAGVIRDRIASRLAGTLLFIRLWLAVRRKRVEK